MTAHRPPPFESRLRDRCLSAARGLASRRADAWINTAAVVGDLSDPPIALPRTTVEIGDRLLRAYLHAETRGPVVESLIEAAEALSSTAHERLSVAGAAAEIRARLAEDEQRPANPPPRPRSLYERRTEEKQASRDADAAAVAAGVKTPADLARENHALARGGDFVRGPDGRPVIASIGGRPLRPAS